MLLTTPFEEALASKWRSCPPVLKQVFFLALAVGILTFGYELFSFTLSVDDETTINAAAGRFDIWAGLARPLTSLWIGSGFSLTPFIVPLLALACRALSCVVLVRLLSLEKLSHAFPVALVYPSIPLLVDQMAFASCQLPFALSELLSLAGLSILLSAKGWGGRFGGALVTAMAVSLYQPAAAFQLTGMMLWIAFRLMRQDNAQEACWRACLRYVSGLLVAVPIYIIFVKAYWLCLDYSPVVAAAADSGAVAGKGLLADFGGRLEHWRKSMGHCLKGIMLPVGIRAVYMFLTAGAVISALFFLRKAISQRAMIAFALICAAAAPSFLGFLLDRSLPARALTGAGVFYGAMGVIIMQHGHYILRHLSSAALLLLVLMCSFFSNKVFFDQYWSWQADRDTANMVVDRIYQQPEFYNLPKPVPFAVVGRLPNIHGCANIQQHITGGASFFWWDGGNPGRIVNFLKTMGHADFSAADKNQQEKAKAQATSRKPWPNPESVFVADGMAVVVLGKDKPVAEAIQSQE